jgi:ABC-2 type transport system permease protein
VTPLLRAELLKLRTTRTFLALTGVAVGTSLLICVLVSSLSKPTQDSVLTDVFTTDTSGLFIVVLAIVGITGEWRHRTITSSLLAAPDRLRFLAAKTLAFAAAGMLLSLTISISVAIVGMAILSGRDLPTPELGDLAVQILRNAEIAALLGAFGLALGSLIRNQPVAIVGVLVFSFAIEPALLALVPDVGRFTPFTGLSAGVQAIPASDVGGADDVSLLSPGLAALALLGYIGVAFAAGVTLLRRRDLN